MSPRRRDIFFGGCAVLIGHALVLTAGIVIDGRDPVIYYSAIAVVLLGAMQLVYVMPLVAYGLWRRRPFALGAGIVAAATALFSTAGLLH